MQNADALAFGGLLLLGARTGDPLGRRRMFVARIVLVTAASLAVGLAQSAAWLIAPELCTSRPAIRRHGTARARSRRRADRPPAH